MATNSDRELITVAGREVAITNPRKVLFPQAGHTKHDLVHYYLAVADGALRAAGDRPNVLVRYPNGVGAEFFYQKRAPDARPDWIEVVSLRFPSGRTAEEVVPRDAATLAWMANLACLELHPHPVRADDLDHPDELRVDLDPVPGIGWDQIRQVAHVVQGTLTDFGLVGWPKTSGSRGMHIYVRIERRWTFDKVRRAALALAREVERRAPSLATSKWWKEERHGVFVDYNQNAKDRTVAGAYSVRPTPDARVSAPLAWDEIDTCDPRDFTMVTMIPRFAQLGHRHADMDAHAYSLDPLLELSERHEREGDGDAPWPPHYKKQEGEPPRVQPSKRRTPGQGSRTRASAASAASASAGAAATADPSAAQTAADASRPPASDGETATAGPLEAASPARKAPKRRVSKHPLIEIGRAQKKEDALAGLERWRARHPDAAALLEPADVLVDAMRGRHQVWWRIRVNLQHVPADQRPPQEALDPAEDPVALAWGVTAEEAREWMRTRRRPSRARKES